MSNKNFDGHGKLIISLDFELLWGVFDIVDLEKKWEYFNNTRNVIPGILSAFENYEVCATWATVGMLFNENWDEWNHNIPSNLPQYNNSNLSAYQFGKRIQSKRTEKLCFAPQLIKNIIDTTGQEVGTHTYSHYYCLEPGQGTTAFSSDLQTAKKLGGKFGLELKSLVFPRNQLKPTYLQICSENGIESVRSNPENWYWKDLHSNSIFTRIVRTGDAYLPFGIKTYSMEKVNDSVITEQKASRFLRPVENTSFLRKLKLQRIISEMTQAARFNKIYHLWWHPHNFGDNPNESLKDLIILLEHFTHLKNNFNFQSLNMHQLQHFDKE